VFCTHLKDFMCNGLFPDFTDISRVCRPCLFLMFVLIFTISALESVDVFISKKSANFVFASF